VSDFADLFGHPPAVVASAPGRVNLIGEHTDYNGGFVLPTVIPQRTVVELAPRPDRRVQAISTAAGAAPGAYRLGEERPGRGWLDYVQGVTQVLAADGHRLGGFDVRVSSGVPVGSGLASSAALEVALLRALRQVFTLALDDVALARAGRRAETTFVGARVGIMDQLGCSLAGEGSALFLDTRSLAWERVPLPPTVELFVIDSGVTHRHAGGDYNTRRAECERACALLGVGQLRDLDAADLARAAALPEPLGRRVRHVVTENARVLAAVEALRTGDGPALGRLFVASHASQRDDFAVSVAAVDRLVALACDQADAYGARLTGGGFGGAIVGAARPGTARTVAARVAAVYAARARATPTVLVPPPRG